jgi:hypothetical protein
MGHDAGCEFGMSAVTVGLESPEQMLSDLTYSPAACLGVDIFV